MLEVRGLSKSFGALRASDGIDFDVREGETHAVIGPNGAGKTTFISQLAGDLRPDGGRIVFGGEDVTALAAPRRARQGLARSFQITSVYNEFSALDNVALAVQARSGHSFRFWRDARRDPTLREPARRLLEGGGLASRADVSAANMSHGPPPPPLGRRGHDVAGQRAPEGGGEAAPAQARAIPQGGADGRHGCRGIPA